MANLKVKKTYESALPNTAIVEGAIRATPDSQRLFYELDGKRIEASDIVYCTDDSARLANLAPLANKLYFVVSNQKLWSYATGSWSCLNPDSVPLANVDGLSAELAKKQDYGAKAQVGRVWYGVATADYKKTAKEIVIKTGIPFISSNVMPLIHFFGYAYGIQSPIEMYISFYIYRGAFWCGGCTSTCPWKPTVKLFTYLVGSVKYVGVALIGDIYFPRFQVDFQDIWSNSRDYSNNWTVEYNVNTNADSIVPTTDLYTVPYKPIANDISGNAATATALTTNAGTATTPVYFSEGKPVACTYTLAKSVPANAVFTDTVYTHPTTAGNKHIPDGGSSGQILRWSADGTAVWGADNNTTYSVATTSANGLMSATDKVKLDGIATNANNYTHPSSHPMSMVDGLTDQLASFSAAISGLANTKANTGQTFYLGTTAVAINRSSGALTLANVSITGNANTATDATHLYVTDDTNVRTLLPQTNLRGGTIRPYFIQIPSSIPTSLRNNLHYSGTFGIGLSVSPYRNSSGGCKFGIIFPSEATNQQLTRPICVRAGYSATAWETAEELAYYSDVQNLQTQLNTKLATADLETALESLLTLNSAGQIVAIAGHQIYGAPALVWQSFTLNGLIEVNGGGGTFTLMANGTDYQSGSYIICSVMRAATAYGCPVSGANGAKWVILFGTSSKSMVYTGRTGTNCYDCTAWYVDDTGSAVTATIIKKS